MRKPANISVIYRRCIALGRRHGCTKDNEREKRI